MQAQARLARRKSDWTDGCTSKGNLLATVGDAAPATLSQAGMNQKVHRGKATPVGNRNMAKAPGHSSEAHLMPVRLLTGEDLDAAANPEEGTEELSMSAMPALAKPALAIVKRKPVRAAATRAGNIETETVRAPKRENPAVVNAKRDRIVLENLPLVKAIAVRVHENLPVHVDMDDLVHAGILGLFDAATKFDPDKMVSFSSYAKHRIKGAILDSLRQLDWASRDLRRRHKQMESVTRELASELHRNPSEHEVAARMGVEVDRWRQMMLDLRNVGLISASQRPADQDDLPAPDFPATPELQPDNICARQEMRSAIAVAMKVLPERYQKVVLLYYTNELTMKEIGGMLGINESRVSQIHKTALEKMAFVLQESGIRSSAAF